MSVLLLSMVVLFALLGGTAGANDPHHNSLTPQEQLGKLLFFDTNLSDAGGPGVRRVPWAHGRLHGT